MEIVIGWTNKSPNTIANQLAKKLGREPTHAELCAEVERILKESYLERKNKS